MKGTPTTPAPGTAWRESTRDRISRRRAIAEQVARFRAAGGPPSDAEAARMIAEFHARGGKITVCAPDDDTPPEAKEPSKIGG